MHRVPNQYIPTPYVDMELIFPKVAKLRKSALQCNAPEKTHFLKGLFDLLNSACLESDSITKVPKKHVV